MKRRSLLLVLVSLGLCACGSAPPAPVDHFYRLWPVSVQSQFKGVSGGLVVQPFQAESLYAERPVVYSEAGSLRQLRQYHYHLWLYPPAQLVREHLVASLGAKSDRSGEQRSAGVDCSLDGRVLRFERVVSGQSAKAVVALDLHLIRNGKTVVRGIYQAEQVATGAAMDSFAVAMEQALGNVYAEFMAAVERAQ